MQHQTGLHITSAQEYFPQKESMDGAMVSSNVGQC